MAFEIGQQIGPYQITAQLGKGGMATVYKARHEALDRDVAIKVMHIAYKDDEGFLERFTREARIVGKLDHPHIVSIYDFAHVGDQPYLVMKYVEGQTLKQRIRRQPPVSLEETLRILSAVAQALDHAHQQGILHRDVKPSNILLEGETAHPYLTDFGLARIASLGESTLSRDMMLGTPQYISPEQAQGDRKLDARTDVYSLGIVLYELVVGRVPFSGDTPYSIIHNHIFTPLPPPSEINPTVPLGVETVLMQALAKAPDERYPSAGALIDNFRQAVERENMKELSVASMRDEAFEAHFSQVRQQSAQHPAVESPRGPGVWEGTPPPLGSEGSEGRWVAQTGSQARKRRWLNLWAVTGCLLFLVTCLGSVAVFLGAVEEANSLTAEPVFGEQAPTADSDASDNPAGQSLPSSWQELMQELRSGAGVSEAEAQAFIDANPDSPLGYFALALAVSDPVTGEQAFADFLTRLPDNDLLPEAVLLEMAALLLDRGHQEEAIRLYLTYNEQVGADTLAAVPDEALRYLYQTAASGQVEDWGLFCRIYRDFSETTYLDVLVGQAALANAGVVSAPDWPDDCPGEMQPISTLIHLRDPAAPAVVKLVHANYYNAARQRIEYRLTLREIINDPDAPEWVKREAQTQMDALPLTSDETSETQR